MNFLYPRGWFPSSSRGNRLWILSRSYTSILKKLTSPHEDTPDEWKTIAEELEAFPELSQVEKLVGERQKLQGIMPHFERSIRVFTNMSNKAYEILTRERLANIFNLYGRIEQEYDERRKILLILKSIGYEDLTGIIARAENSLEVTGIRLAKPFMKKSSHSVPDYSTPTVQKEWSPCIQKVFTISRIHNYFKQLKANEEEEFSAAKWKELVDVARNCYLCTEYGDTVGYVLLLSANYGLKCCKFDENIIDFVSAAVVRYDSEEPPSAMDNISRDDFLRCLSLCYLGELYIKQQRLDDAERTLSRALHIVKQLYPKQHPRQIEPLRILAKLYEHKLDPIYAEGLYRSCLDRLVIPSWTLPSDMNSMINNSNADSVLESGSVLNIAELRCQILEDFASLLEKLEWNQQSRKAEAEHLRKEKQTLLNAFPSLGCSNSRMRQLLPGWYCDEAMKHFQLV